MSPTKPSQSRFLLPMNLLASGFLLAGCSDGGTAIQVPPSMPSGDGGGLGAGGTGGLATVEGTGGSDPTAADTFHVEGAKLYDRCDQEVVLRGVNEMIVWSSGRDGIPEFAEIAKTGANAARIVWNAEGSAAELDAAIANALSQELIPVIENHDATGDLSLLPDVLAYWTRADVVEVLRKHESDLLLNIANEAGDSTVTAPVFQEAYEGAITQLRAQGLTLPLIIDAPQWGQKIDVLQETWQALTQHDPEHNLMFSVHMWWSDPDGTRVKQEIAESVSAGMPLMVGEFAQHAVHLCDQAPFAYSILLDEAEANGIGWFAWSWGGVANNDCADEGPFDMTTGGVFGEWTGTWAEEVAVAHAASITNTSVRPASIVSGACSP